MCASRTNCPREEDVFPSFDMYTESLVTSAAISHLSQQIHGDSPTIHLFRSLCRLGEWPYGVQRLQPEFPRETSRWTC